MKTNWLFAVAGLFMLASCGKELSENWDDKYDYELKFGEIETLDGREPLSKQKINDVVLKSLQERNEFRWDYVDAYTIWSAANQSDSLISIGYQPAGYQNLDANIHQINVKDKEWAEVYDALTKYILKELSSQRGVEVQKEDVFAFGFKPLPYFNVKLADYEIIAKLRTLKEVRYVEPMSYGTELNDTQKALGCGNGGPGSVPSSDYSVVSPNAKVSWNYEDHNVEEAWALSQGDNITIGVIDTGISPSQSKLNSQFSSGESTGRYREKYGFFESCWWWWCSNDGPNDDCGHGTGMSGTATAPRTSAGSTTGVAYKSNLISCRGTDDVVINSGNEKDGVSDSFYFLGNRGDVDIISMSLGDVFYSGQVADAVNFAHNKGKMIFCAAGTSLSWTSWWGVIFPANLSNTVAVTGVRTGAPMQRCNNCHDGSAVDFVVTMQDRNNTNRTAITLADYGNTPRYTGGSSVATATTAGIAALVWAENPSLSREEVMNTLIDASEFSSRDNNFGWGRIDAFEAVSAVQ